MTLLSVEGLRGVVRRIAPPIPIYGIKNPNEDAILNYFDLGLELSNTKRAENLSVLIRDEIGIYRFGPMCAEYRLVLEEDRREVWLQASDRALVINIYPTVTHPLATDVFWDRTCNAVNTFDVWDPKNHKMQMYYQISAAEHCIPETITPWHVSRDFAVVLGQIEQAIEQPIWPSLG